MPELPEVETIRRELVRRVGGSVFASAEVRVPKMANLPAVAFSRALRGRRVEAVSRRAKMLVLRLSGHRFLVFHLKMTGQLVYAPPHGRTVSGGHPIPNLGVLPNKFTHVIFRFRGGGTLYFNDQRKFGWVRLLDLDRLHRLTAHLGAEPLSAAFSAQYLRRVARRYPNRAIKSVLMDNALLVGVGNIYADESCYRAGIRPTRRVRRIADAQLTKLHRCVPRVLRLAIRQKGTTHDTYRRVNGRSGGMLGYLRVYGRTGLPCKRCRTPIVRTVVGQRGTHYCPRCQR